MPNPRGPTKIIMEKTQIQIDALIKLQEIDTEIYRLQDEQAQRPAEKEGLQKKFAQEGRALKHKEEELKALQLKRKEHEIDLQTKEKEIGKYQTQLLQVKTNKEYMSLQKEIAGLKADNSVLEDEILQLLENVDKLKAEIGREKARLTEVEQRLKARTQKIDQTIKETAERITALHKEREKLCPEIDRATLARYERVLKAKAGLAFVPIVGESCGGCHRVLPPQVINEAQKKDKIITCEFCACLLYWPQ